MSILSLRELFFKFWPFVGLTVIVLMFLWRGATMQGIFFGADEIGSDIIHFSYPHREYFANEYLKHGKLLLWNSYVSSGVPVIAQVETEVFNPIAILLFLLFPVPIAFNWMIIVSYLLVALGMYLYCRTLNLSQVSAFYTALVFTLSFFMVAHLRHIPIISTISYMPFIFWALENMIKNSFQKKKHNLTWSLVLAVSVALSFLGGSLSTMYPILLVVCCYFLIRVWLKYLDDKIIPIGLILLFLFGLLEGIILAGVQLVPSFELFPYSSRSGFSFNAAISIGYYLKYLLMFLFPYIHGDPSAGTWSLDPSQSFWENIGYIGILPLCLSIFAVYFGIKNKHQYIRLLSIMLLFVFLLTLGNNTFIYHFFWDFFPGFRILRVPGRFLLFVDFTLAVLAGYAVQYLYQRFANKMKIAIISTIFLLTVVDLFYYEYEFNTVMPMSYFKEPKSVQYLHADPELFRISSPNFSGHWQKAVKDSKGWRKDLKAYFAQREILTPDMNILYRIPSSTSLADERGRFAVARPTELDYSILYSQSTQFNPRLAILLGMENVKYIIIQTSIPKDIGFTLVATIPSEKAGYTVYLYKNTKWLPRAYFVGKATYFEKTQELLDKMFLGQFNPAKEVLLEGSGKIKPAGEKGNVTIKRYEDEKVSLTVDSTNGGYVVLSDSWYPGWNAYVDGKKTEILRANYAYRALYVDKGIHTVLFSFAPNSFKIGQLLSISGVLIFVVVLTFEARKQVVRILVSKRNYIFVA